MGAITQLTSNRHIAYNCLLLLSLLLFLMLLLFVLLLPLLLACS